MERIGILGTGRMGGGLTRSLSAAGYTVLLGSRDAGRAAERVRGIEGDAAAEIRATTYAEAAREATIVIPALGFNDLLALLPTLREELAGKVVVDLSTPWGEAIEERSAAEQLAALLPPGASLIGAWKSTFAGLLDPAARAGVLHDVLVSGDDAAAKQRVMALIEGTGFRAVDCGDLTTARVIEGMVRLMGPIARRLTPERSPLFPAWKFLP